MKLRNVKCVTDRSGSKRYYFQMKGRPLVRLPDGPVDSQEFIAAWKKAAGVDDAMLDPMGVPGLLRIRSGPHRGRYLVHKRGKLLPLQAKFNSPEMATELNGASAAPIGQTLHDDIVGALARSVKRAASRAKEKGREFAITIDDMVAMYRRQRGRCALTGMMFYADPRDDWERRSPWTPSIDRKESKGGYTVDNVHLVSTMANLAKAEFSVCDFHRMCAEATVNNGLVSLAIKAKKPA